MELLIQSSVADHQRVKKQRVVDNVHVDAADDAIDFRFLFDSDEQDLNEITWEEYTNNNAAINVAKPGFRFVPSDEYLVKYLCEKVYGGGEARSDRVLLGECDMYGDKEPWNIWNDQGGSKLNIKAGEDLYFFTKLNKVSNVNGSRNYKRRVGSGTWSGAYCRDVAGGVAKKRHFSYENEGCSEHHHAWIMHEYRLVDLSADYVLCRLRKKRNKDINNKNTGLVNDQTKNLALVNDQEIIKKQRLGVESECDDQVLDMFFEEVMKALNGTENFVEIDDDADHGINNISKSSSTSTTAVQGHGDQIIISEDDNDASLKSTFETYEELEELEKIMPPSYSTLDMFWEEEVMKGVVMDIDYQATNNHGTAGADDHSQLDVDYGTNVEDDDDAEYSSGKKSFVELLNDSHMEEAEEHDIYANNNVAKSTSGAACDEPYLKEISQEDNINVADAVAQSSSSSTFDHMEVGEEHRSCANNNVVKSPSGADCGVQDLKEISREECINAAAANKSSLSSTYDHMEVGEEEHSSSANNNVARSTSGAAHLSQLDVDFGGVVEEDDDDEYLSGKKSYAQLLKDIPLYYVETHDDQDDVLVDTVVDL